MNDLKVGDIIEFYSPVQKRVVQSEVYWVENSRYDEKYSNEEEQIYASTNSFEYKVMKYLRKKDGYIIISSNPNLVRSEKIQFTIYEETFSHEFKEGLFDVKAQEIFDANDRASLFEFFRNFFKNNTKYYELFGWKPDRVEKEIEHLIDYPEYDIKSTLSRMLNKIVSGENDRFGSTHHFLPSLAPPEFSLGWELKIIKENKNGL